MKFKKALLISIIFNCLFLSGCWNYREIEQFSIVSGFAIDKSENKYILTAEIIESTGGRDTKTSTKLISSEGVTIFDAIRNMIRYPGKKLYFSHTKVVIISSETAKEGMIPVLDLINRDIEPRYTMKILISKNIEAKKILEAGSGSEIFSYTLDDMLDAQKNLSSAPAVEVWEFINDLCKEGVSATLPTVTLEMMNDKATPKVEGSAVFKGDKLIGYLNGKDTKTFLFIKNKIKGGLITKKINIENNSANMSLEIFSNKTKIKPKFKNSKLIIDISTDTDVSIGEVSGDMDFSKEEVREKIKSYFEEELENQIKDLIKKVQTEYDSDIFGFGSTIKIKMPSLWKEIEPKWDEVFKTVDVNVKSNINIKNTAYTSKPIKMGD
ncbi:Ger(x)C family spore germination protein [Caloramator sp. E03]|uniref:Ger(x)C family spore germination protein n=1 Tax=Caloramator sp. E03 TaxID=2576307 RepID=UPI001110D783|nr:Ger(x)C family spore germination protein [Caloramator sp. E03]QCX33529.1 Ger(x)C family spore germination protein [Caloramator sp. E03]